MDGWDGGRRFGAAHVEIQIPGWLGGGWMGGVGGGGWEKGGRGHKQTKNEAIATIVRRVGSGGAGGEANGKCGQNPDSGGGEEGRKIKS